MVVLNLNGRLEWNSRTNGATPGTKGAQSVSQLRFWMMKLKNTLEVGKPRFGTNERLNRAHGRFVRHPGK